MGPPKRYFKKGTASFTSPQPSRLIQGMHAFIDEATVTPWGMWVGHHLDFNTSTRGYRRTLIWERLIDWDGQELSLEEAGARADQRLAQMGLRRVDDGWWCDLDPDCPIPHYYAVLERIPGSTKGWKD